MNLQFFLIPALGAMVIQLLNLMEAATLEPAKRPNFKDFVYWLPYIIHPILAAIIGWAYFDHVSYNNLSALQIGACVPLFIKQIINVLPKGKPA